MPLSIEEKKSIIAYRVQKADSVFIEASDNATMNHWNLVANRLYYAVFHMASALLIDKGFTSKTHSGVICLLGQEFATKGGWTKMRCVWSLVYRICVMPVIMMTCSIGLKKM